MREHELTGLNGADPLGFLAAVGLLRIVSRAHKTARLKWIQKGDWIAILQLPDKSTDLVDLVLEDLDRWRKGHLAVNFAIGANRKVQDLKHPPDEFRALMAEALGHPEAASFVSAYATGVAVDGTGMQSKPTSLHFCAGQQRFMDAILSLRQSVIREDFLEALRGPWIGRIGPKDTRWRAGSERYRALCSFDPSKEKSATVAGAAWLAFQAMPLFPVVPWRTRVVTTGFIGRGKRESFVWPLWFVPLSEPAIRCLVATRALADTDQLWRDARGVAQVFEAKVVRSTQGYGNFAPSDPR